MKKFFTIMLFAAMLLPWATQGHAQCTNGADMCSINVHCSDSWGDGWGANTVQIYQGTTLRGTASLAGGDFAIVTIPVCPDSIRIEWVSGTYSSECSFVITDGMGDTIFTQPRNTSGLSSGVLGTVLPSCPSCSSPFNLRNMGTTTTSATLAWSTLSSSATYEIVYGPSGINPDSVLAYIHDGEYIDNIADTTITLTNLATGVSLDCYVRANCGSDYSSWIGINNILPGTFIMSSIGTDTLRNPCGATIFDFGGATGSYAGNSNSQLIIFAPQDSTLIIDGTINTEAGYDFLYIYDGIGTSGELLGEYSGNVSITDPIISNTGVLTLYFTSDGSASYDGYELHISCTEAPACSRTLKPTIVSLSNTEMTFTWVDTTYSYSYEIEYDTAGFELGYGVVETTNDTIYQITGLEPNTEYEVYLRVSCSGGGYSNPHIISFKTACNPISTDSLPYIEGFNNTEALDCYRVLGECSNSAAIENSGLHISIGYSCSYSYFILPIFEDEVNTLQVNFNLKKASTYYEGVVELGVMSNPSDKNTFTSIATCTPEGENFNNFNVYLSPYTGEGKFIAFRASETHTSIEAILDSIVVSRQPECSAPENLRIASVGHNSAIATWEPNIVGEAMSYTIEISETGSNIWSIYGTTTDLYTAITGLTLNTQYDIRITAECAEGTGTEYAYVTFRTLSCTGPGVADTSVAAQTLFIGDTVAAQTTTNLPTYMYYGNTYSQQLFTNAELAGVGTIRGIDFNFNAGSSNPTPTRNIKIYLTTTSATNMDEGFIFDDHTVEVYNGSYTFSTGWNHIEFDTLYPYGGNANLLLTFYDHTGSWISGGNFSCHATTENVSRYYYSDSQFNPADLVGTAYNRRNNVIFHSYPCDTNIDGCLAPLAAFGEVGETEITLTLAPGGSEQSWSIEYKSENDSVWYMESNSTSNETYTITGLTANTTYQVRVTALCGSETASTIISARTECGMINSYPWSENFNNVRTGMPSCWSALTNISETPGVSSSFDANNNGKSLDLYYYSWGSSTEKYVCVITPKIDTTVLPIDTLQVSFSISKPGEYDSLAALIIGVMSDPSDINTFVAIDTVTTTLASVWQEFEVPLRAYQGYGAEYIALISKPVIPNIYENNLYLDNFQISAIPNCSRPSGIVIDTVTSNSVTISWATSGMSDYVVEYGLHGFELGTGTSVSINTNTITLNNLNHSAHYDVYVAGLCSGSDTSEYSFPVSFFTECGNIDSLPFSENFNSWGAVNLDIPHCWTTVGGYYPMIEDYIDFDDNPNGGSLLFYSWNATSNSMSASLPMIDPQISINTLQISFSIYGETTEFFGGVAVGVSSDPNDLTTFVPVDTIYASTPGEWLTAEVSFDNYSDTGRYITFVDCLNPLNASYAYEDVVIDNIVLEYIPTCRRPTDLTASNPTATSVDLSWTDLSNATSWIIEYDTMGFEPGTGTIVAATGNPFTLTGLTPASSYEYYVRSVCSASDSSEYSRTPCRFTTSQVPATIPYLYTLEAESEWNNWQTNSNLPNINWHRGTAVAGEGTYSMYVSADNGLTNSTNDYEMVNTSAYRDIDFGTIDTNFILTFKTKVGGADADIVADGLAILMVDPSEYVVASDAAFTSPWGRLDDPAANLELLGLYRLTDTNVWQTINVPIDNASGIKRLAFFYFNQETGYYYYSFIGGPAAIDSIAINYDPCPRPSNLQTVAVSTTTASLSWDGASSGYIVYYREANDTTIYSQYTTSNTYTITGLNSDGIEYLWAVRSVCGTDTSLYSDTESFITSCFEGSINIFPYTEGFENSIVCWNQEYEIGNFAWEQASEIDESVAYEGSYFAYFFGSSSDELVTTLVTPVFDLTVISDPYIKFAHMQPVWVSDQDTLGVYYRVHQDSAWVYITSYTSSIVSWQIDSLALPNASATYQIGFRAANFYGYGIGIDDILIDGAASMCPTPTITAVVANNTATISWSEAGDYEIRYRKATDSDFGQTITVTNATSYVINNLEPLTEYVCQVRRNCNNELGYSNWAEVGFTTEDLPCGIPTNIAATNITYSSATISWTDPNGTQTSWTVEYGYGENTLTVTATTTSIELTDLYEGTTYNVRIQGNCSETISSEWSDVYTFTTSTCEGVSNLTADNISSSSATISWTAPAGQTKWELTYGMQGVDEDHGTKVTVTDNPTYTIEGLDYETSYDVYVRAVCADGVYSSWSQKLNFTTRPVGINTAAADNTNVNIYPNPANTQATITVEGVNGKVEFAVADMNGRMIVTETIDCNGELVKTIDVSNLAKGAYFVHIYNDNFNAHSLGFERN